MWHVLRGEGGGFIDMHVNLYNMGVRMSTGGPIDMHVSLYNMGVMMSTGCHYIDRTHIFGRRGSGSVDHDRWTDTHDRYTDIHFKKTCSGFS